MHCSPPAAMEMLLGSFGEIDTYGPADVYYCQPDHFRRDLNAEAPAIVLTAKHAEQIRIFRDRMGWFNDHHAHERTEDWLVASGVFDGDDIVALGRVWLWSETIAALSISTLPEYRKRGYADKIGFSLTQWVLDHTPYTPQIDGGRYAVHLAEWLGYQKYGQIMMTTLTPRKP